MSTVSPPEIRALTGIRAFAAFWVLAYHFPRVAPPSLASAHWLASVGYLGVDLFFVLSGFIISYNYWPHFSAFSFKEYRRFLGLRLARVYPVHCFTLAVSGFLMMGMRIAHFSTQKDFSAWTWQTFATNSLLIHAWRQHYVESWNNPSWSVSCEWFAYLIFPALALLPLPYLRSSANIFLSLLLVSGSAIVLQTSPHIVFLKILQVFCEFASGCLAYHAYVQLDPLTPSSGVFRLWGTAVLLGLTAVLWIGPQVVGYWIPVLFPLAILGLARSSGIVSRMLASKPAVYWGKVSYSVYMTHAITLWPLKSLLPISSEASLSHNAIVTAVYLSVILIVAALTYHLVEEPARRWLRGGSVRRREPKPLMTHSAFAPASDGPATF